jgi:hypothetical protein
MKKLIMAIVCLMTMVMGFTSCELDLSEFERICFEEGCERTATSGSLYCSYHSSVYDKKSNTNSNYRRQCAAYTNIGNRCKRTAEKGGIYCWQHKYNH